MNQTAGKKPLLAVDEALERLLRNIEPLSIEMVSISAAHGRVLAEDLVSKRTQPPFAASAMDGYAVRADDCASNGVTLDVIGEVAAGYVFDGSVEAGQCVRIFTGAPLPDGTDSILIQEDAEVLDGDNIRTTERVDHGTYVRPAGLDFKAGQVLLKAKRVLDAGAISLAASGNHDQLRVVRRPKVGILATGDELRPPGSELEPGQIIASNAYGVAALLDAFGTEAIDLGIAEDNEASLNAALSSAKAAKCDALITLGGASVGKHDLVQTVFTQAGMTLDFWKIAMRPGKPLMFGNLDQMRILGLPGNPVSSLVCTHLFVKPLIFALSGRPYKQVMETAVLETPIPVNKNREHYMRSIVSRQDTGYSAQVFENQDSSMLATYADANALIFRAIGAPAAEIGETVNFIALRPID